ncbi:hypothetical protein SAMN05421809_3849 [Natronorubrum daqingense]|uniref:Uncharacterized protein n=1 Tax=Natronorubrum daqingense TaxID=588898 RepID=A0A1N7GAQ7_9EURY|nr:hypothetical protein SAMN05421809_3849 [Natronorubrum daqingense]
MIWNENYVTLALFRDAINGITPIMREYDF